MHKIFPLMGAVALGGCASTAIETPDERRPVVSLECLQLADPPRERPFLWCKLESVHPDTPATRQRAEEMVARIGTPTRRPPADELFGSQTVKYRLRLGPVDAVSDDDGG